MSRRHHEEIAFGSDSFLDVIANIVGILIILIVVAGVRVSQAPAISQAIKESNNAAALVEPRLIEPLPSGSEDTDPPLVVELYNEQELIVETVEPEPEVPDFIPPPNPTFPKIDPALLNQKLATQVQKYKKMNKSITEELDKLSSTVKKLSPKKAVNAKVAQTQLADLKAAEEKLQALLQLIDNSNAENRRSQQVVDQLLEKKKQTEELEPEAETLAHKLNPIGKVVSGKEVHFRLIGNEVSFVPIQLLSDLVKHDMQKRRDYLLKQRRFQSRVGPVNGYEMEYLVQRSGGGLLNQSRYGTGVIRVAVSDWVLRPTGNVFSETLDEAIAPGSQFRRGLISKGTNATITFWVYPDSFELHHQLKQMVHDSGFWVASRPLPMGYPIAGSATNGSKSIAQ